MFATDTPLVSLAAHAVSPSKKVHMVTVVFKLTRYEQGLVFEPYSLETPYLYPGYQLKDEERDENKKWAGRINSLDLKFGVVVEDDDAVILEKFKTHYKAQLQKLFGKFPWGKDETGLSMEVRYRQLVSNEAEVWHAHRHIDAQFD